MPGTGPPSGLQLTALFYIITKGDAIVKEERAAESVQTGGEFSGGVEILGVFAIK